jgi:hypothetical protein
MDYIMVVDRLLEAGRFGEWADSKHGSKPTMLNGIYSRTGQWII